MLDICFEAGASVDEKGPAVVFVGQGIGNDKDTLLRSGFNLAKRMNDCVDTADLHKASCRDRAARPLGTLLLPCGIGARNLHNAGDNLTYNLRLMIAITLNAARSKKNSAYWDVQKR